MAAAQVILLPGSVLPAELAYGALVTALGAAPGDGVDALVKDLEVYGRDFPPPDYSLDMEVAGVLREADARGWDQFHLVGYSAGGAVALAAGARCPERLLSLGLLEPAWAGSWGWTPAHERLWAKYDEIWQLSESEVLTEFMRLQVRPGVRLPPPPTGRPPPWMKKRPAGIRALTRTFSTYDLDRSALAAFARPVYFALGGLSNPVQFGEVAERLSGVFPDFTVESFAERHHFDPPHRQEPERLAGSLHRVWVRAARRGLPD